MFKTTWFVLLSAGVAGVASAGPVTLEVRASSAPNVFGSPSWSAYASNALNSLENNLGNIGDRNVDPTAYAIATSPVSPGDFMVSSFNSWRGVAGVGGAFASELGNRMHFGLHAYGDGVTQFALEDLSFEIASSDSGNELAYAGDFVGLGYTGTTRYGINWGPDRAKGGGDDVYYTSGNGTTLVDELVYVGVGNAFWPQPTNGQSDQDAMDESIAWINSITNFHITGTYWINGDSGSDSVMTATVPLPSAAVLSGAGLLGLGLFRPQRARCRSSRR